MITNNDQGKLDTVPYSSKDFIRQKWTRAEALKGWTKGNSIVFDGSDDICDIKTEQPTGWQAASIGLRFEDGRTMSLADYEELNTTHQ